MAESFDDQLSRVEMMATDDGGTWDLSENDQVALHAVIVKFRESESRESALRAELEKANKRLTRSAEIGIDEHAKLELARQEIETLKQEQAATTQRIKTRLAAFDDEKALLSRQYGDDRGVAYAGGGMEAELRRIVVEQEKGTTTP